MGMTRCLHEALEQDAGGDILSVPATQTCPGPMVHCRLEPYRALLHHFITSLSRCLALSLSGPPGCFPRRALASMAARRGVFRVPVGRVLGGPVF